MATWDVSDWVQSHRLFWVLGGEGEAGSQMKSGVLVNPCEVIPPKEERVYISKGAPNIRAGQVRSRRKCSPCPRTAGAGRAAPDPASPSGTHLSTRHLSPQKDHGRNFFPSPSRKSQAGMSPLVLICGEKKGV